MGVVEKNILFALKSVEFERNSASLCDSSRFELQSLDLPPNPRKNLSLSEQQHFKICKSNPKNQFSLEINFFWAIHQILLAEFVLNQSFFKSERQFDVG